MKPLLLAAALAMSPALAFAENLTGEWTFASSVGTTPITVHCRLVQTGPAVDGLCAPDGGFNGPLFRGTVKGDHVSWGYDVDFRGQKSHVGFEADYNGGQAMKGTLTLGGRPSAFTATKG
jgi:hypothetical protein